MDPIHIFCKGKGCRKCKRSVWIELLGYSMADHAINQRRREPS
jgi:hypothetical protein